MAKTSFPLKIHCEGKLTNISSLTRHSKNANVHPGDQVERLAKILLYQGFRSPIVVSNLSGSIVAGHGRLEAAIKNGWLKVPVVYQDFESEEQEIAHLHADNAIAFWAQLDFAAINNQIGDLGPDFDLDMLGINGFSFLNGEPLELLPPDEASKDDKQHVLEVMFRNPMELRDLYDDLISKGFMAKIKGGA